MALWSGERLTLTIESDAVRLMGVARGRVTRWGAAPLPRGTVAEGTVTDPARLAEVLERLWASQPPANPAPRGNLVLAIPGTEIASTLAPTVAQAAPDRAGLAALAREALPRHDAYYAHQLVGPPARRSLFVLAAPTGLVDSYVAALERAGLGIAAVDVKPLALIRAVGQRSAIIVDGERALGTLIIVEEALPRRVRFLPLDAALLASPEDKAMRLAETLFETVQQHNRETQDSALHPATPVFLTGSLADHALLRDATRDVLGHPLGTLATPLQTPGDMPLSQFAANLGLALKRQV